MLGQPEVLDISYNSLTGEVPSGFGEEMVSLVSIDISFNHLTGSLPTTWMKSLKECPQCFIGKMRLCLKYNANNVCVSKSLAGTRGKAKLLVGVIVAIALGIALTLMITVAVCWWWQRLANTGIKSAPLENIVVRNLTNEPLPVTFEEIMATTDNLFIGRHGYGVVYKVPLASSMPIVVKKIVSLNMTIVVVYKSFWREIETVGKVKHRNLVKLLGFIKRGQ